MKRLAGVCLLLACGVPLVLVGQEPDPFRPTPPSGNPEPVTGTSLQDREVPETVQARLALRTPKSDELLYQLESEYVELLKVSSNARKLLEAERLLATTNDNTHWTNYSSATKVLRAHRDKAAIPLLLRYIVLHAERSSAHVMIPEYAATISAISGYKLQSPYVAGPELPARMRVAVSKIVDEWWSRQAASLEIRPGEMSAEQLEVLVNDLLRRVRGSGRLSGSGGAPDSAYFVYHIMYYGIMNPGSTSSELPFKLSELHPDMTPVVLKQCGFRSPGSAGHGPVLSRFRYEAVPLLAALRKNGCADELNSVATDNRQNEVVRLTSLLSLYHAGEPLLTDELLKILHVTTGLENRLIALSALRAGGQKAVPVLLKHLEDPNVEICTAAACSLRETQPREALAIMDRRIREADNGQTLIMLFGTLEAYENEPGRRVLAAIVEDSLTGKIPRQYLSRALYAFENSCDQDWEKLAGSAEASEELQARVALAWFRDHAAKMQRQMQVLAAQVENTETQLEVAASIEELRHAEYKRLLGLQADDIVTSEQAEAARRSLTEARAETEAHRKAARELTARLETLKAELQ